MIGIDTNVLVRYLVQDDEEQSLKVSRLIEKCAGNPKSIFINNIVVCELIWVLARGYKYSKNQIILVLKEMFLTLEFAFENHQILWLSLSEYEKSDADFSDVLIGKINIANECKHTVTFDQAALTLKNFIQVEG